MQDLRKLILSLANFYVKPFIVISVKFIMHIYKFQLSFLPLLRCSSKLEVSKFYIIALSDK